MTLKEEEFPAFAWDIVDDVIVTRQFPNKEVPDPLWDAFIKDLKESNARHIFSLTIGSATLKATQRKSAADVLRDNGIPATVITDNRLTRGILTAVSWLGAKVKAFSWDEIDAALAAAEIAPREQRWKIKRLAENFLEASKHARDGIDDGS